MSKNEPTLVEKVEIAQRRHELSILISQGVRRHKDLAERLGVSERTVRNDLEALERELSKTSAERIVEVQDRERMVSWQRLEDYLQELRPMIENKRTRIQALRLAKEIEERRSKLLGLDMPTKHAATDPTGKKEYRGIPEDLKRRALERQRQQREQEARTVPHRPVRYLGEGENPSENGSRSGEQAH